MNTRGTKLRLPQFRRFTVQSEQPGQTAVTLVGTGGTVFLRGLSEGIQQTPPGWFGEFLMPGMFEFLPDGQNITRRNRLTFRRHHQRSTNFIIIEFIDFQLLCNVFQSQKLQFQSVHRFQNQTVQFDPGGMPTLQNRTSSEAQVTAYVDTDPCGQPNRNRAVMAVADADAGIRENPRRTLSTAIALIAKCSDTPTARNTLSVVRTYYL